MKKQILNIFQTILLVTIIFGCSETITIVEPDSGITIIKLIQSSSNQQTLDWTYFDPSTYTLHDLIFSAEYQSANGYYQFESGFLELRVYEATAVNPAATVDFNFDFEHAYTAITYDDGASISNSILVVEDTLAEPDTSKTWVRFINLSTDIDDFNVNEETQGTLTSFNSKGTPSEYIELDVGTYRIDAVDATSGAMLTNSDSLVFRGGLTYKIIFSGSAHGTNSTELNAKIYAEF